MNNTHTTPAPYIVECLECPRTFDMNDANDVAEYTYGHDCEA